MHLSSPNKALYAGVLGTVLQWYDFALFGYFAPIIATTYFPNDDRFAALLSAFGIFAVGYLLAPLGSLLFGYIGDRFGRKRALTISILAMAIPTALISLVPSYEAIGLAAPILITLFRVIQGFVASSEFTGSAIFLVEHAKEGNKAFYGCLTSSAYSVGSLLAGLTASLLTASFMPDWGWRIGFAMALIAGLVIFYLRFNVQETPEYMQMVRTRNVRFPFLLALKENPLAIIGVIGLAWLVSVLTFGTYIFTATYLHRYFNMSLSIATLIITFALAVDAVLEPFFAILADRIGFLKVVCFGLIATICLSLPIFLLLATGQVSLITLSMALLSLLIAMTFAPLNAYMISLFPHHYRYSGFGVAFHIGISLFGGTTPLALMWLVNQTGNLTSPAYYYIAAAIIGLASLRLCEYSQGRSTRSKSATLAPVIED
ncbi:proline betaine transport protein like protein [Legionella beliardensis]|uniref:Proline betaine transport protein like protein n=1 Tax=Legionella beliardensis TaxID=91822 RepID=A0A378I0P1_9GAMM|nr:MFS transporter [Legionella beliardensis]STX28280.1 proline betaine transport protein like protein [Legionella beliardensis]